jgi:hydroxysqualene dehydroxylase
LAKRVAVIGAGWAGLAAAVRAVHAGHQVTVFEATRSLGGRARGVEVALPSGERVMLDNGQHVLLGAYRATLALMEMVGVDLAASLTRLPVKLGMFQTQRWSIADYGSLVRCVFGWCLRGFKCPEATTVEALCQHATPRVMTDLLEPLCLSALNTSPKEASGCVFLRVLKDAFLGKSYVHQHGSFKSSDMLIPKVDLSTLFPSRAALWLQSRGAGVQLGERVASLSSFQNQWIVSDAVFNHVIVATPPWESARLLRDIAPDWAASVDALAYRAIATVYALAPADFDLASPMRALASDANHPAQFVFARRESKGLLAFVVSDSKLDRVELERLVLAQGESALGVALQPVITIVEKRATFACLAEMTRPAKLSLAGLSVVGDYVEGAYPATIEGAVLSTLQN